MATRLQIVPDQNLYERYAQKWRTSRAIAKARIFGWLMAGSPSASTPRIAPEDDGPEVSLIRVELGIPDEWYAVASKLGNELKQAENARILDIERDFCAKVGL